MESHVLSGRFEASLECERAFVFDFGVRSQAERRLDLLEQLSRQP